jgi:hypothetical protein
MDIPDADDKLVLKKAARISMRIGVNQPSRGK